MVFADNNEAFSALRNLALRAGFDIATRQTKSRLYGEFHCRLGGRARGETTGKTGCPFRSKTQHRMSGGVSIRIDDSLCLEHNHELDPAHYARFPLPTEVTDLVVDLSRSGIKPVQIMKFMEQRGIAISGLDIQWLTKRNRVLRFEGETDDLIRLMVDSDGSLVKVFEARIGEETHRWGVLTFSSCIW